MEAKVRPTEVVRNATMAFNQGSPLECLSILDENPNAEAVALRCRALLELQRYLEVISLRHTFATLPGPVYNEATMLLGVALTRVDREEEGIALIIRAGTEDPKLRDECAYHVAVCHWTMNAMEAAKGIVAKLKPTDPTLASKVTELSAWIEAKNENYPEQLALLKKALPTANVWHRCAILHAMSALVRDMFNPSLAAMIREEVGKTFWTPDTKVFRFNVIRNLGWCAAMEGNDQEALRLFRAARKLSTTQAGVVKTILDAVMLARGLGSTEIADFRTTVAMEEAEEIAWDEIANEDRTALLMLAEQASFVNPMRAYGYLAKYDLLKAPLSVTSILRNDDRERAFKMSAYGAVHKALAENDSAILMLEEAYRIYARIGYRWRAALCLVSLMDLKTGEEFRKETVKFLQSVTLNEFPNSWFTKIVGRRLEYFTEKTAMTLTPARKDILHELLRGKSHKDIANELGITEKTVGKRSSEIYGLYEVRSQAELIARFATNNWWPFGT